MLSARGTQDFAAPELLLGQMWNERVDIWASGQCFYFFLRGKRTPWPLDEAKKAFLNGRLPEVDWSILPLPAQDAWLPVVNGCVIIPDEPANSAPPPPPVMVDSLLNAMQTLQTVGKAQTRTEVYQSLALDVANPDTILPCWCQLCLRLYMRLYRDRKECFRCLGEKDRKHSCGLGKVSNYLVKPGANKAQLRGEFSKHFEGSARMTMKYVKTLAAYRQR
ncbi:unnamed protein product [Cladocopium goreaui]|uniref:Protein kinase domain-containing protein n=1 Tax=Cladocopium goreaui TaxID=2562237 RepID=A0A9P1G4N4_9DINO|nr:unnamed protein product [Cladocopium goreaui]